MESLNISALYQDNFGILQVTSPDHSSLFEKINLVLTIDRSGSMDDICPDGKSKMQQCHHTIKNIIRYVKESINIELRLSLLSFDEETEILCNNLIINDDFNISPFLNKLQGRGMTNIEAALKCSEEHINSLILPNNNVQQIIHIFMTDGEITVGSTDTNVLSKLISIPYTTFIGYGNNHDTVLLKKLSNISNCDYYFAESLENSGMIYGEILYNSIYQTLKNFKISVKNGKIYNYLNNKWCDNLSLSKLSSGQTKTWQISKDKFSNQNNGQIQIENFHQNKSLFKNQNFSFKEVQSHSEILLIQKYKYRQRTQELLYESAKYREIENKELLEPTTPRLDDLTINRHFNFLKKDDQHINIMLDAAKLGHWYIVLAILEKNPHFINSRPLERRFSLIHHAVFQGNEQILRQLIKFQVKDTLTKDALDVLKVAEIGVKNGSSSKIKLDNIKSIWKENLIKKNYSEILTSFLNEMKEFMIKNNLKNDDFMKRLTDDIYIAIKAYDSNLGELYINARAIALGTQRAYNVSDISYLLSNSSTRSGDLIHNISTQHTTPDATPATISLMREISKSL